MIGKILRSDWVVLIAWVVYLAVLLAFRPDLARWRQAELILGLSAPLIVLAVGQLAVLRMGGIDLSVSGVISLAGVLAALVMAEGRGNLAGHPAAVPLAMLAALALGAIAGTAQGLVAATCGVPPFLVTLTGLLMLGGAATWIARSETIGGLPVAFLDFLQADWLFLPAGLVVALTVVAVVQLLLNRTVAGRQAAAIGHNPRTARVAGVSSIKIHAIMFATSGLCSGLAAVLYLARTETAQPAFARDVLLDAIAAAVLGGASLAGGRGTAFGVAIGALFVATVGHTLTLLNWSYPHVVMAKGGVILLAAALDAARSRGTRS